MYFLNNAFCMILTILCVFEHLFLYDFLANCPYITNNTANTIHNTTTIVGGGDSIKSLEPMRMNE